MAESPRPAHLPDFLVVGVNKCGTTALAQWLASHPEVCFSRPKEPHFFDARHEAGLDAMWHDHFAHWAGQPHAGEGTSHLLNLAFVAPILHRLRPAARLVVCLRDPVDRAFSHWWMHHSRGTDPLSFAEAVADNLRTVAAGPAFAGDEGQAAWRARLVSWRGRRAVGRSDPPAERRRLYLETGHYATNLEPYLRLFGRNQVHVLFQEDLRRDAAQVLRGVGTFLGLAQAGERPLREANAALSGKARPLLRALDRLGLAGLAYRAPKGLKESAKRLLASRRQGDRAALDPATRRVLADHYRPHNQRLRALLGRIPDSWDA